MEVEEGKSVLIFRESLNLKEEDELGLVFFTYSFYIYYTYVRIVYNER